MMCTYIRSVFDGTLLEVSFGACFDARDDPEPDRGSPHPDADAGHPAAKPGAHGGHGECGTLLE